MLTLHTAPEIRLTSDGEPLRGAAVAVDGDRVAAVGQLDELTAVYPQARVRRWPGVLTPGLLHAGARAFLEETRHPDPREPDAVPQLPESARRGIHLLLRRGVTAVVDDTTEPSVRSALDRSGLLRVADPRHSGALLPGARADLAAFDAHDACIATVLAGRLVHRRT